MNPKDARLLFEIDKNYRQPYSKIGKKIGMSQQLINYKVKSLASDGVVIGNYPLIDYSRLGYLSFRVYFKINYLNWESFEKMINSLKNHPNITSIMECDSGYDLMILFSTRNPSAFNKALREVISEYPKQLKNCMILTTVVEHLFSKNYLTGSNSSSDTVVGGDRNFTDTDPVDKKILKALTRGKKTVVEMSTEAGITSKTAMNRLKIMENKEIIKGYRLVIDTRKIKLSTNKILIKFHSVSIDKEKEIMKFCLGHPGITEVAKTFGEWDLELTVIAKTREEFRNICILIRQKFEDIIADFDNFRIFKIHKKQLLPDEFFAG